MFVSLISRAFNFDANIMFLIFVVSTGTMTLRHGFIWGEEGTSVFESVTM